MTWDEILIQGKKLQAEMIELSNQLQLKKAEYTAFTKEYLGLIDGAPTNVLELAEALKKISSHD